MAATPKDPGPGPAGLPQHKLVEALRPDPGQAPPDAVVLQGFLGDSTDPASKRLYLTSALDGYVEIPVADILHTARGTDGGMDTVWVPRSLTLTHHQTASQQVQAEFLSGSITGAHLAAGAGGGAPVIQPTPTVQISVHVICPTPTAHPSLPFCPTETCLPSRLAPCVSHFAGCPSLPLCPTETCPPSRLVHCVTAPTVCAPAGACLPHTIPPACPITVAVTVPAVCLHTFQPACPITVAVTVPVICGVHTLPNICSPISGGFACPVSVAGCPSGPACQPGTIVQGQGPGA